MRIKDVCCMYEVKWMSATVAPKRLSSPHSLSFPPSLSSYSPPF